MADVKISELPLASGVTPDDLFVIVDNPDGSPVTKQVAAASIIPQAAARLNPPGMARLVTVQDSGTFSVTARSSTGYIAARWWDGSVQVFGSGNPGDYVTVSKSVPSSGNWSKSAPKEIFTWSCTAGNATQSGDLTNLDCNGNTVLTSLNVSGLTALTTLNCSGCLSLASLNVSGLTALTTLDCYQCDSLTSLNVSGCTALTGLACFQSYSLASLNVSGCTALTGLFCSGCLSLASLNASGLTALTTLDCGGCTSLTSLRAVGVAPSGFGNASATTGYVNISVLSANLSATALNQLYTDLGTVTYAATIGVAGNPGTASDDPTIATAKGWIVYGS